MGRNWAKEVSTNFEVLKYKILMLIEKTTKGEHDDTVVLNRNCLQILTWSTWKLLN